MPLSQTILNYIEYALGKLLYNRRGYDSQLLCTSAAFDQCPEPSIPITSPDCGPTNAKLTKEYSMFGAGKFPNLEWPAAGPDVKEYVLVSEDPDAPLGHANPHGVYCFIPPTVTSISNDDLELLKEEGGKKDIKAGYRVGKNRRNVVYIPPRPPMGHGPHRYFFELVALNQPLSREKVSDVPTVEELKELVKDKVVGWGLWLATYERTWE